MPVLLVLIAAASVLLLITQLWTIPGGEVLFALVALAFPVALCALGAQRHGRLGRLRWGLLTLLIVLELACFGMLQFRGEVLSGSWVGGVPAALACQWVGLGVVPLALVGWLYAVTFESQVLDTEALERLRARSPRQRGVGDD